MHKLIAVMVMMAGVREGIRAFGASAQFKMLDDIKKLPDGFEIEKATKEQRSLVASATLSWGLDMLEILAVILGALTFRAPFCYWLLVMFPLSGLSYLIHKYMPMPVRYAYHALDHAFCAALLIAGPVVFR